jgi:hypothetical protein
MKTHYCKAEKTIISFEGECNWCGAKEEKQLEMIERVKELVKQCEFENYDWNGTLIESGFNTEKFAKLIVQEFKKEPDVKEYLTTEISPKLLKLAKQAGFILTDDRTGIDWSSNYDDCLIKFAMLLGAKDGINDV